MKTRYLAKIYKIENVLQRKDGGLDDITEQTEDQLDEARDFQYMLHGDSLQEIIKEIPKCGIDRDSKDDDCGHLNKVSSLPSKDTKKEGQDE